jgi:hypothetical protein
LRGTGGYCGSRVYGAGYCYPTYEGAPPGVTYWEQECYISGIQFYKVCGVIPSPPSPNIPKANFTIAVNTSVINLSPSLAKPLPANEVYQNTTLATYPNSITTNYFGFWLGISSSQANGTYSMAPSAGLTLLYQQILT